MAKKKPIDAAAKPKAVKKAVAVKKQGDVTIPVSDGATPAKDAARTLTHDDIGQVAGLIWQLLNENGEQSPASIKSSLGVSSDLVLAAIGWLAREDKLWFASKGRSILISLR
jgi:cytoskeletal protein RodZ